MTRQRVAFFSLLTLLLGSQVGFGDDAKDFSLFCRKGDGQWGYLDVTQNNTEREIVFDANEGYAQEIATALEVSSQSLNKLKIKFPISDCSFYDYDKQKIECNGQRVKLEFNSDHDKVELQVSEARFVVEHHGDTYQTYADITLCGNRTVRVDLTFEAPIGKCESAKTAK